MTFSIRYAMTTTRFDDRFESLMIIPALFEITLSNLLVSFDFFNSRTRLLSY